MMRCFVKGAKNRKSRFYDTADSMANIVAFVMVITV